LLVEPELLSSPKLMSLALPPTLRRALPLQMVAVKRTSTLGIQAQL
jgi:hypothetical protein